MGLKIYGRSPWWYTFIVLSGGQFAVPLLVNIALSLMLAEYENTAVHIAGAFWALVTMIVGVARFLPLLVPYAILQGGLTFYLLWATIRVAKPAFECFFMGCSSGVDAYAYNIYFVTIIIELGINFALLFAPVFILVDLQRKKNRVKKRLGQAHAV